MLLTGMLMAFSSAPVFAENPQTLFKESKRLQDAGDSTAAIKILQQLVENYPELPEPYNNLAVIYAHQHEWDKARDALEMAIRTNPDYAAAYENLGDLYTHLAALAREKAKALRHQQNKP